MRINRLADRGSVHMIEENRSSVIVASVTVAHIPVILYVFDNTHRGGAFGCLEGESVLRAIRIAEAAKVPLVGLCASAGANLLEGQLSLVAAGKVFQACHNLDVPHLFLSYGPCIGAVAYLSKQADFVLALREQSFFCLTGPKIVKSAIFCDETLEEIGGAQKTAEQGGLHMLSDEEEEMEENCRKLLRYLKRSKSTVFYSERDEVISSGENSTMEALISNLLDDDTTLWMWSEWAKNAFAVFGYLGGRRVGIFANNPEYAGGVIDRDAALKAAKFYKLCSRLSIPVLSLADTPGFLPGAESERSGVLDAGAEMIESYLSHRSGKMTVAAGRVLGGAYMAMGCKEMGARAYAAFPQATIGVMGASIASEILRGEDMSHYEKNCLSVQAALKTGCVDRIVDPSELKAYIMGVIR
ncbi:MAG: carboxyl transferase domain-containing protein [Peptoniphilus sp.]|nr:carboxyl transferase domain-containing protein [Peptoniphilus sp.]MDD7363667.1 carboxyl transferase domain-containing protein [Bacillota bacterium]MDY6044052.1 carboxyl transferase domain-containing protein [Peptoniphilus sp.]